MPSFRAVLQVTGLRPGVQPEAVMSTAIEALGSRQLVEASQLDLVRGVPQITLRFTVDPTQQSSEDRQALDSAAAMKHAVDRIAATGRLGVLRRQRGRWIPLA
jgi:hypothetical protein